MALTPAYTSGGDILFTSADNTKLDGIETAATADQTGAEIKTAYEAEANAFTDAQFTKLAAVETSATADQTGAEIKTAYEAEANAFTDAQFTKLAGVETSATADQSAAELLTAIKTVDGAASGLDADLLDGVEGAAFALLAGATMSGAIAMGTNDITGVADLAVGATSAVATAAVEIVSTTQGFLPPRMTTTQRDAISTPAAGLMIYNTTTAKLNVYTTSWEAITSA